MAVSPDVLSEFSVLQEQVTSPAPIVPLRRSRSMAESVALNTHASEVPIEQVVGGWALQRGARFVEEMLHAGPYNSMPEAERSRLLRFASRTIAENWIVSLGYTAKPRDVDDKVFFHNSLIS